MGMTVEAYARQLTQLLPRGPLWTTEAGSVLGKLLLGLAEELARIDARGEVLLDEADPRTADETLEDWERVLGITPPDGATENKRRVAAAAKYVARGGQTPSYFVALAASLGITATVTEIPRTDGHERHETPYAVVEHTLRAGIGRAGRRSEAAPCRS
jgi:uncharacterized protein YmfQ (DUF2313 family)